jgi:hypothetical protein
VAQLCPARGKLLSCPWQTFVTPWQAKLFPTFAFFHCTVIVSNVKRLNEDFLPSGYVRQPNELADRELRAG